jgi:hypothetical protein
MIHDKNLGRYLLINACKSCKYEFCTFVSCDDDYVKEIESDVLMLALLEEEPI